MDSEGGEAKRRRVQEDETVPQASSGSPDIDDNAEPNPVDAAEPTSGDRVAATADAAADSGSESEGSDGSEEDGEDSEEESEEEELPELKLDQFGRIVGVGGPSTAVAVAAWPGAVDAAGPALAGLVRDCEAVVSARAMVGDGEDEYSQGHTYWVPATATPRTTLEKMALEVFRFHTRDVVEFDMERSGAEWWTLVMDGEDDVAFHWDKDYGLEEHGLSVHPLVGTVTYLSHGGAPTTVLRHTEPVMFHSDASGDVDTAWVSRPRIGKHMAFDGRFLHAAPEEMATEAWPKQRVTLLVNVWLEHVPVSAAPLSSKIADKLATSEPPFLLKPGTPVDPCRPEVIDVLSETECVAFEATFGVENKSSVSLSFPRKLIENSSADTFELRFAKDTFAKVVRPAQPMGESGPEGLGGAGGDEVESA